MYVVEHPEQHLRLIFEFSEHYFPIDIARQCQMQCFPLKNQFQG
jgi:hypothetical protein